jgi:hypothetical protein
MEEHSSLGVALALMLLLMASAISAHAQTPTPTPTPSLCSITTLPDGSLTDRQTGAEAPPSFLGVSGGSYNSLSVTVSRKNGTTVNCCAGTLGALVRDNFGKSYVLSSNHVMARNSSIGKPARINSRIVQPGLVDLSCWQDPSDTVARLSKAPPINFSPTAVNQFDAAIAKVMQAQSSPGAVPTAGIDPEGRIFNLGQISATPLPFSQLEDGLPVMKMARTSCLTSGVIDAFDAMGVVVYPQGCNVAESGTTFFDHQILVIGVAIGDTSGAPCTFAETGDSGALVVTQDFECPRAIGLMFAAEPSPETPPGPEIGGQIVVVNPIQSILSRFKVTLTGKTCTPSAFGRQVDTSAAVPQMSERLYASIEQVRSVKKAHARKLLGNPQVVAVGIGAGDTPDTTALNVYLRQDTPEVRRKILSEISGAADIRFKHAARFRAL